MRATSAQSISGSTSVMPDISSVLGEIVSNRRWLAGIPISNDLSHMLAKLVRTEPVRKPSRNKSAPRTPGTEEGEPQGVPPPGLPQRRGQPVPPGSREVAESRRSTTSVGVLSTRVRQPAPVLMVTNSTRVFVLTMAPQCILHCE